MRCLSVALLIPAQLPAAFLPATAQRPGNAGRNDMTYVTTDRSDLPYEELVLSSAIFVNWSDRSSTTMRTARIDSKQPVSPVSPQKPEKWYPLSKEIADDPATM